MNTIVFLVLWLRLTSPDESPVTAAQFLSSYHSVAECSAVKARIEASEKDFKGRISCLQVVASPLADAGTSF